MRVHVKKIHVFRFFNPRPIKRDKSFRYLSNDRCISVCIPLSRGKHDLG